MKLLPLFGIGSTFAFSKTENAYALGDSTAGCLVCEYVNIANTEQLAIDALEDNTSTIPCIAAKTNGTALADATTLASTYPGYTLETTSGKHCVATFFMFEAKDMNNKVIYGVRRTVAESEIANGNRVDVDHYDGVKGYQLTGSAAHLNVMFTDRAEADSQFFAMDGRDDYVDDSATDAAISTTSIQVQTETRCLVCHGSQEFTSYPSQAAEITMPCWNPSGSNSFQTDVTASLDPTKYCIPSDTGLCYTKTFQYGTKDSRGVTTSNWMVISRGCVEADDSATQNTATGDILTGNTRSVSNAMMNIRMYAATNSASKAKDNAKYPDNDVADQTFFQATAAHVEPMLKATDYDIRPLTVQFSSPDGSGKPDAPTYADSIFDELECLQCVTPIGNTDNTNDCVNAKTTGRVKCKTLSCSSISSAYKLGEDASENFYYSKRGCTADPDDGTTDGEQAQADKFVVPDGWTNIKQQNQRSTTANGNTGRASTVSTAQIFDCFSCESTFSTTLSGANAGEPTYDSVKSKDNALCWQTFSPTQDSSTTATGTSGSCTGRCFVSAYKYKQNTGTTKLPATEYNWYVKRGCDQEGLMIDSSSPADDIYGVEVTNRVCDYSNGTLCNGNVAAYETTLEIQTQTARLLQCFQCETAPGNTDKEDKCYTVLSTEKAENCPDLSYTSCVTTQSSYTVDGSAVYNIKRGCHKGDRAEESALVPGFTNVKSTTEYCSSGSCNKAAGDSSDELTEAVAETVTAGPDGPDTSGASIAQIFVALNAVLLAALL
ncbi:unnamed protein product [Oikopleura dioica]|uniref:Uncharacterized protein n=1 Tax=Oikopleura dioica TaxID=34765 RepID=E4XAR9_OIKDI|nr:unnamed protein product [Oikopleura dioica]